MEGFTLEDSTAYDDWQFEQAERLRDQLAGVLERLVHWHSEQGQYSQAIDNARRWLALDPLHEPAHQQLMKLYAWDGQHNLALRQYQDCVRRLDEELGVSPTAETTELYEDIRARKLKQPIIAESAPVTIEESTLAVVPTVKQAPVTTPTEPRQLEGERRIVTALVAEIKGYPTQSAGDDLETWAEMAHEVLQILETEVLRFGGEVNQYRDEGLLALFGKTTVHEDDPERAVLAALAMQDAVKDYAANLSTALTLRVGINTGEVIATVVGDQHRGGTALGRVVGLAERMGEAAELGAVLVAEATYRLIEPLFEWQILGRFQVQGVRAPVGVFRPLAHKDLLTKGRGIEGLQSALVGRDAEFQASKSGVERMQTGIGGIITIVGEAGIGKSRLVAELKSDALENVGEAGVNWLEGRCLSYATNVAYQLWINMLRTWLDTVPDAAPEEVVETLQARVREVCPDAFSEVYPFLARILSLPMDEIASERLRGIDAGGLQVLTFRAVETLIDHAAQAYPLVLVCEDLHWGDPTSQALLEYILPLTDRVPLLLMCVMRPETAHSCWQIRELAARDYHHRHADLWLEPLSPAESGTLIGNLLYIENLPADLRDRILKRAAGNPFFLEEILRSLMEDEAIIYEEITDPSTGLRSSHWVATREIEDLSIPETLHGVLTARIDRLTFQAKRMLQLASVIGRTFSYRVLEVISGNGETPDLESQVIVLQRAQLIRERARLPEREYIFKHVLTQEAAYNGLLKRERRTIHLRVAEVLEGLYPEHIAEQLGLLAHHWEQAGDIEKAVEYLRRAGEQAAAQYANAEAVDYLSRALELAPETDMVTRYDLLLNREQVYDLQGKRELQAQDLEILAKLAKELDANYPQTGKSRQAAGVLRQAKHAHRTSDEEKAMSAAKSAVQLAHEAQDTTIEAAAYREWGRALEYQMKLEPARVMVEKALSIAREYSYKQIELDSLHTMGNIYHRNGDTHNAQIYYEQELRICREIGNRRSEGEALRDIGTVLWSQNDYVNSKPYIEQSLLVCRETGNRRDEGHALSVIGDICNSEGNYSKAEEYGIQALHICRETQDLLGQYYAYLLLTSAAEYQREFTNVLRYYKQALHDFRKVGHRQYESLVLDKLGWYFLRHGQLADAQRYLEQAVTIHQELGNRLNESNRGADLGRLFFIYGAYENAKIITEKSLAIARDLENDEFECGCLILLGFIVHALGDDEAAHRYGQQALTLAQENNDMSGQGRANLVLGHALTGLREWDVAVAAYNQSIDITKQKYLKHISVEAKAGLSRLKLMCGDYLSALALVEDVLQYMQYKPQLLETWEPFRIYLTSYQVLEATGDPRAQEVLEKAYSLLQERAATIEDEALHRSFLENVPENREIVALWERMQTDKDGEIML